jgi:hypothetical protein
VTQPKAAEPVRIKLYGLFPTTRRRYVAQVVVAGVLIVFLLVSWAVFRHAVRDRLQVLATPLLDRAIALWDLVPWIVAVVAVLQVVEAYFAFRAFARKRAETAASQPPPS